MAVVMLRVTTMPLACPLSFLGAHHLLQEVVDHDLGLDGDGLAGALRR